MMMSDDELLHVLASHPGPRCHSCRFWEEMESPVWHEYDTIGLSDTERAAVKELIGSKLLSWDGFCRRYPPVFKVDGETEDERFHQPITDYQDWCGEWQPKEAPPPPGASIRVDTPGLFSARVRNHLGNAQLFTLGDVANQSAADLLGRRTFGLMCLQEVRGVLAKHGLKLKGE